MIRRIGCLHKVQQQWRLAAKIGRRLTGTQRYHFPFRVFIKTSDLESQDREVGQEWVICICATSFPDYSGCIRTNEVIIDMPKYFGNFFVKILECGIRTDEVNTRRTCWGIIQALSADPNPQYFLKSTAVQMEGVLLYKWEAYCSANGRCTAGFPYLQGLQVRKVQQ